MDSIEINECASAPCANGATCTDFFAGYVCLCAPGWTGLHCDDDGKKMDLDLFLNAFLHVSFGRHENSASRK